VGAYRTEENGAAIDAAGVLPREDGSMMPFSGPVELGGILAGDPRFVGCITEKLLTYAVGRSFVEVDAKEYTSALTRQGVNAQKSDWRSWPEHVTSSEAFLTARGEAH
jgi:hypothetical protein